MDELPNTGFRMEHQFVHLRSFCGDFLYSYVAGGVVAQEVTLSSAFTVSPIHSTAVVLYVLQLLLTFPCSLFVMLLNANERPKSPASNLVGGCTARLANSHHFFRPCLFPRLDYNQLAPKVASFSLPTS